MKHYKPTTPGRRGMTRIDYSALKRKKPEKRLTAPLKKTGGRGFGGRITTRHKGGGHKRKYRLIDFKRFDKLGIPAKVEAVEYDPNRSCFIMLLHYQDGEKRYVLAPEGIKEGKEVICREKAPIKDGNRMQLKNISTGTHVYNVELNPQRGGQIVRSAGSSAEVRGTEKGYTYLRMPSNEIRLVGQNCWASVGQLSNIEHSKVVIGKAGRNRWLGKKPTVRGTAMSAHDHPHGGGEGNKSIGLRKGPKTPWGKLAYGVKTRKKKKSSSKLIIKRRGKKKK